MAPRPKDSEIYYNFSSFTMKLNEAGQEGEGPLAPTDCRHRWGAGGPVTPGSGPTYGRWRTGS